MSLREKERAKEQQEKFQAILSALLKDEDNKYCVDCDAKGPRWASWNLGIFLCIRCAGIHRNLGVHISRVKSVNLDSWTGEQVAMMQEIGNSRGRAVYEANIPDGFRRPQSDSALEAYIRSKYEQKKYIAREWVPPTPKVPKEWLEDPKNEKKKARAKPASGQIQLGGMVPKAANKSNVGASSGEPSARPAQPAKTEVKLPQASQPQPAAPSSAANDLLGLEAVVPAAPSSGNELLDLFGGPQPGTTAGTVAPSANNDLMNGSSSEANLFEGGGQAEEKKTSTKDSIMALFGGTGSGGGGAPAPQQMYNIPASSAAFAQNGLTGTHIAPATAAMPGSVSSSFTPSVMSSSQAMPGTYAAQQMMYGAVYQSQQSQNPILMASQPQQSSTTAPTLLTSQPNNIGLNQQPTSTASSFQAQNLFNPPVPVSQNYNAVGGQTQMQSLMSTNSAGQNLQPSVTGMTPSSSNQTKVSSAPTPSFGQNFRPPNPMYFGQNQACFYGGMYMPQGQQAFGGMMVPQQNMVGQQPNMMGQQPNMMGYQPNMMGQQPQGMMGTNAMNGSQMGMYNNQMMPGAQGGMYTPQQMQQLQFKQMQQQMAAMNMGGPQQMQGGWGGNPSTGQTLSNNLWQ